MAATLSKLLSPVANGQLFDDAGNPLAGGTITVYKANTLTLAEIYSNSTGAVSTNPIVLNSSGRIANGALYVSPGELYDIEIKKGTVTLESYEGISGLVNTQNGILGQTIVNSLLGDGVKLAFTLTDEPADASLVTVIANGLVLTNVKDYAIAANVITFTSAPAAGVEVIVKYNLAYATQIGAEFQRNKIVNTFTTANAQYTYTLTQSPVSVNNLLCILDGFVLTPIVDFTWNYNNPNVLTLVNNPGVKELVVIFGDLLPVQGSSSDVITYSTTGQYLTAVIDNSRLTYSAIYDPPSLAAGAQTTTTIAAAAAALGDFVKVSFSNDQSGITFTAYVSSAGTVTVILRNGTAGTIDLASGTLRVRVDKV